ncbi:Acetyl-CoA:Cys-GlcN-Ins acetyltransferase, mycothiol synthase MshD [Gulosibacter sp. 10]|nr:Acetyl-CoA:Cys-GlcN-Ins acetyltransferase, mycothiol synthase MshD [Gulosibacter sp. 10]
MHGELVRPRFTEFAEAVALADGAAPFNEDTTLNLADRTAHLIEAEGELRALALSHALEDGTIEAELAVHPQWRAQGLGAELLGALQDAAAAADAPALQLWAHGNHPGGRQLAGAAGFALVRTLYQLELPLPETIEAPEFREGERIRPFDRERDGAAWVELNAKVFADHPEQGRLGLDDLDARIAQDWFDAADFLVLESAGGEMLGYNWLKITPEEAEIYVIGVAEKAAGRGYGTALMQAGLARIREHGAGCAVLYVDGENERAVALYRRLGFVDRTVDVQYRRAR